MNTHPKILDIFSELRGEFRAAREAKGWSQQRLGEHLGVHWITISKIERGVIGLSRDWIDRLSNALDVQVHIAASAASIGSSIRSARKARNLSQSDIADQLGVTVQAVSQWERDETIPTGINLLKLSGILGIELPHGVDLIPSQNKVSELREQLEEVIDLLHAIDKIGDGIGGADGYSVSAVAIAAKSVADNALDILRSVGGEA